MSRDEIAVGVALLVIAPRWDPTSGNDRQGDKDGCLVRWRHMVVCCRMVDLSAEARLSSFENVRGGPVYIRTGDGADCDSFAHDPAEAAARA